MAKIRNI